MCDCEVAHEPPRRTYWLHMNLPLYSPSAPAGGAYAGYGEYELLVHSQTSPNICAGAWTPAISSSGLGWKFSLSTKFPAYGKSAAATSHSNSVGKRAPAHRANASASK